ncbi:transglycosylase SLT domain-containing protein [Cupriavidus sp. CuC1]|uniref:transglycosylase SLT domain-containing protein n=1 Tax=Cupriavidus sp. CuC1 TaxID=3373131 RepID=UPI0037CD5903
MPRVPTYDTLQATPTVQPNVRVDAPQMQDVAGQQAQQMGQGLMRAGDAAGRVALDMQNEANQLRVIDATSAAREKLYDLMYKPETGLLQQKGWNALQRDSGKDLATEYSEKFQEVASGIADTLGNDEQRRLFSQQTMQLQAQLHGTATQHMGSEYRTYQGGVMDAEIKSQQNAIGLLGATDPGQINPATGKSRIEESAQSIFTAARAKARLAGLPQALADTQALDAVSGAHKLAVDGLIESGKYEQASAYRERYKDQFNAHDLLDVAQKIDNVANLKQGYAAVDRTFSTVAPQLNPSSFDRAFNIAVGTESGGRQFGADGKPLTSPKGAIGIAQVMPDTAPEAAKLAGLPWDENRYKNDPDYNKELGRAYFQKQVQDFGGNLAQAYAAYNAGPGAARDALAKAKKDGGDWLANLPVETQAYVHKNMAAVAAGAGAPKMPTQEELQQQVLAQMPPDTNPKVRKAVEQEVERRFAIVKQSKEQLAGQAVDDAMTWLRANDYNWSAMPVSLQSRVPSDKMDNLMDYAAKGAKGIPVQTNLSLYQILSSDDYLRKLTPQQFAETRQQLSDSDFKKFADRRDALTNPNAANGPSELNTQAIGRALEDRLALMGVDTKPKHTDTEAQARLGMVRKMVDDWVLNAQQTVGKKLGDAETTRAIDDLFRQSVTLRSTFMGMAGDAKTQPLLSLSKASDIPDEARKAIESQFKARGITPSDADMVGAFIRGKLSIRQNTARNGATGNY